MKIISGSSNQKLAAKIAAGLQSQLLNIEIKMFPNGEKRVWINDQVRGENIALIQSLSSPVDEHIIETLLILDALERLGARNINLIIPWMGYSFQDKVFQPGEPIAAKVVANLLSHTAAKRAFLLDLHNSSIPGFFSLPTEHLSAMDLFVDYVKSNFDLSSAIVASPDFGGLKKARVFADKLGLDLVNVDKKRDLKTGEVTPMNLYGSVRGKNIFIFDDAIMTGRTTREIANYLKTDGAIGVYFLATHGIFAGNAIENIGQSQVDSVIVTNSIDHPFNLPKIVELDISNLFINYLKNWL